MLSTLSSNNVHEEMDLLKKNIVKNTLTLSTGTLIASSIPILLQPLLRRLFSPEDFGAFAVYLSITGILVVVSTFRYELAVVLPKEDQESWYVISLSVLIAFLFNLMIFLVIFFGHSAIIKVLNFPEEYSIWFYFVPLSALLFSSFNVFNYWLIRKKAFRSSGLSKIIRRSGEGIIQLITGRLGMLNAGLFIGDLTGHVANLLTSITLAVRSGIKLKKINWAVMKHTMKQYFELALYNTIPTLLNTISLAMPIILVNKFYSKSMTGQLDLARLILFIPLVLFTEPLAQVFYQFAVEKNSTNQSIFPQVRKMIFVLTAISCLGIIIIQLWSVELFSYGFGKEWQVAAGFSSILVFSVGLRFIIDPFRFIFATLQKIWIISAWQVIYFLAILSLLIFRDLEINQFLIIYVVIESACYIILLFLIIQHLTRYEIQLKDRLTKN